MEPKRNPLRVLMVIPGTAEGTTFIYARRQGQSLEDIGIEVGYFFLASRTNLLILYKEAKRFRKQIKEFRPDVVHAQYGTMTAFFTVMNTKIPAVITFQGSDLNSTPADGFISDKLGRLLSNLASLRAKAVICVSKRLVEHLIWKSKNAYIIPNGININQFDIQPQSVARQKLGWKHFQKVIVFNANNPKIKRLDLAQKAVELAAKEVSDLRLEILAGEVHQDTIPLILNASDCLLICSDSEGSPLIVKEAMTCNLPIVGVDVGDVTERINKINNCIIVEKDSNALAKALVIVISNNKRSNGREVFMQQGLDEKKIALELRDVYDKIKNN